MELTAFIIGYMALVLGTMGRFYFYHGIRGRLLLSAIVAPVTIMFVEPIFLFIKDLSQEISLIAKVKLIFRLYWTCIINYPTLASVWAESIKNKG